MLMFSDWSSLSPSQKVKVHGPRKVILGHFNDFGHFPIEIPIEVKKNYGQRKEWSYNGLPQKVKVHGLVLPKITKSSKC